MVARKHTALTIEVLLSVRTLVAETSHPACTPAEPVRQPRPTTWPMFQRCHRHHNLAYGISVAVVAIGVRPPGSLRRLLERFRGASLLMTSRRAVRLVAEGIVASFVSGACIAWSRGVPSGNKRSPVCSQTGQIRSLTAFPRQGRSLSVKLVLNSHVATARLIFLLLLFLVPVRVHCPRLSLNASCFVSTVTPFRFIFFVFLLDSTEYSKPDRK